MSEFDFGYRPTQTVYRRPVRPPRSRVVYAILGVLFGATGLHNLYARRHAAGLLQFALFVLSIPLAFVLVGFVILAFLVLWALANVVTVETDGSGRYMT